MPIIYKHNLKHFASNQKIAHEPRMNPVYHYDNRETVHTEGAGIFSGIGSIVNLIKK